jgi:LTXXQ motif.
MKKRIFVFALAAFIVIASLRATFAQEPPNLLDMFTSDAMQRYQQAVAEDMYQSLWEGTGTNTMMYYMMSEIPDYRDAIGITPEQFQQIRDLNAASAASPEFAAAVAETQKYVTPSDPFLLKADEATKTAFVAAQRKAGQIMNTQIALAMEAVTTPEQKQRMREIQIASMDMFPIPNPSMFEALNLTDEQKSQMKEIQAEMEAEFKQTMSELNDVQWNAMNGLYKQMKADGIKVSSMEELHEKTEKAAEKLNKTLGKDFRFVEKEKINKAQEFVKSFKFRMYDVLTDAQMSKMWELINRPPEYMSKILERMKKNRAKREASGGFQPGPNSWKPGDPIPADYIEHRKAKFPKKK